MLCEGGVDVSAGIGVEGCVGGPHLEAIAGDVDQIRGALSVKEVWEQRIVVYVVTLALVVEDRPVAGAA